MSETSKDITTNTLRAISAGCLLILSLASMFLNSHNNTNDIIMIALASFLVGGAILSNINTSKS